MNQKNGAPTYILDYNRWWIPHNVTVPHTGKKLLTHQVESRNDAVFAANQYKFRFLVNTCKRHVKGFSHFGGKDGRS